MAPSNTISTGPPLGTFALTMCLTDGAEVRRMTMPSNNEQVTVWPPLVWSLSASEASSPALTTPLSPKANVFCSLVTAYGSRVTSAWWRFPFRIDSLPGGAVSSRMPYSCGALLHQGGHGCVRECGLLGDEVVAFGARTTLTNRRQSAWQWSPYERTTIRPAHSGRKAWQCAHGERQQDASSTATTIAWHSRASVSSTRQDTHRDKRQGCRQVGTIDVGNREPATLSRRSCCGRCGKSVSAKWGPSVNQARPWGGLF